MERITTVSSMQWQNTQRNVQLIKRREDISYHHFDDKKPRAPTPNYKIRDIKPWDNKFTYISKLPNYTKRHQCQPYLPWAALLILRYFGTAESGVVHNEPSFTSVDTLSIESADNSLEWWRSLWGDRTTSANVRKWLGEESIVMVVLFILIGLIMLGLSIGLRTGVSTFAVTSFLTVKIEAK